MLDIWLAVAMLLLALNLLLTGALVLSVVRRRRRSRRLEQGQGTRLVSRSMIAIPGESSSAAAADLPQSMRFGQNVEAAAGAQPASQLLTRTYVRQLHSVSRMLRQEAAVALGVIGTDEARLGLETALTSEKRFQVRLHIANALADIADQSSIPVLVNSLVGENLHYRDRVNALITSFGDKFAAYLPNILEDDTLEIQELIVDFCSVIHNETTRAHLVRLVERFCSDNDNYLMAVRTAHPLLSQRHLKIRNLAYKACEVLVRYHPRELLADRYTKSPDKQIRSCAVRAIASSSNIDAITKLVNYLDDVDVKDVAASGIRRILQGNSRYVNVVADMLLHEQRAQVRKELAGILTQRTEYFVFKLTSDQDADLAAAVLKEFIHAGRITALINFLNVNKDADVEKGVIEVLRSAIPFSKKVQDELQQYLAPGILETIGLTVARDQAADKKKARNWRIIGPLYLFLVIFGGLVAGIFYLVHREVVFRRSPVALLRMFILDFNYVLAGYSLAASLLYFCLALFGLLSAQRQKRLWRIKDQRLLFKDRMLPSVSILAPAFNEQKTIVENVNSLLTLTYPEYELIVVNDGSTDETLSTLISSFNLVRVDHEVIYTLDTKNVRAVYRNSTLPKLTVVDKENGGKADALNVGINLSRMQYICAIDADSLLEPDALLKIASQLLDFSTEVPVIGGSVLPVNGCRVDHGTLVHVGVPKNALARFQAVEYVRAFMSGRLGWAALNNVLIVSGAFGLFDRKRLLEVGGYLTSSSRFQKDTVGEDMELVVRIRRFLKENKIRHRVCFSFNASCWTEVPEDLHTLKRQRYRWQRGLIESLLFHRKMLFNPAYGSVGLVAMPYFFVFEMAGPFIETLGYILVVAAGLLGILNVEIALMLFVSTVLAGVLVSLMSLLTLQHHPASLSAGDTLRLIVFAVLENFGPRQLFSLWRVGGYLNMLITASNWNKAERKGFTVAAAGKTTRRV